LPRLNHPHGVIRESASGALGIIEAVYWQRRMRREKVVSTAREKGIVADR
jgi:hypothetical protein